MKALTLFLEENLLNPGGGDCHEPRSPLHSSLGDRARPCQKNKFKKIPTFTSFKKSEGLATLMPMKQQSPGAPLDSRAIVPTIPWCPHMETY